MEQSEVKYRLVENQLNQVHIKLLKSFLEDIKNSDKLNIATNYYFYFPKEKGLIKLKIQALKKAIKLLGAIK